MVRPAATAAALIAATIRATCAGLCRPPSQPLPMVAVRRIAALLSPPIQSGSGCCTGSGAITASRYS